MEPWLELFARVHFRRSSDTAHDLKTPLNVAVLNLELLRMRLQRLEGHDDEKLTGYARALDVELRRMAQIFDTFFVFSTPPKNESAPELVDVLPIAVEAASHPEFDIENGESLLVRAHESRIRTAVTLFCEGAACLVKPPRRVRIAVAEAPTTIEISGKALMEEPEITKVFKFYYTDPFGNPNISLAGACLIAETYGGSVEASCEDGEVVLRMSFGPGVE